MLTCLMLTIGSDDVDLLRFTPSLMRPHVTAEADAGSAAPATLGARVVWSGCLCFSVAPLPSLIQPLYSVLLEEC